MRGKDGKKEGRKQAHAETNGGRSRGAGVGCGSQRSGTPPWPRNYLGMGMTKAIRKQAVTAERVATQTANTFVSDQMKNLAEAFRAQADVLKKKKKKKK